MTLRTSAAALPLLLSVVACDAGEPERRAEAPAPAASPAPTATAAGPAAPAPMPPSGVDDGVPDLTPPTLTPVAERGETGARNILLSFARAIELAEYRQAWSLLSAADRRRWSEASFAAMFADLSDVTVAVPTGQLDGPAGEGRYTAPVTVTGRDNDGRPVRLEGTAVLRQGLTVDSVSAGVPRWQFETLALDWTH